MSVSVALTINPASTADADILTRLSFASKGYWGYPEEYFEIWKDELTITPAYILENDVFIAVCSGKIVGYFSIVELENDINVSGETIKRGHWLEHLFVAPAHIGQGIGTALFHHVRKRCRILNIASLGILADPHSRGFYEKTSCVYQREIPSTIEKRTTPFFLFTV